MEAALPVNKRRVFSSWTTMQLCERVSVSLEGTEDLHAVMKQARCGAEGGGTGNTISLPYISPDASVLETVSAAPAAS
jgi:hypothetical protein